MIKLQARGMNKKTGAMSEVKHFKLQGLCDETLNNILKVAFPDWPELFIINVEEAA